MFLGQDFRCHALQALRRDGFDAAADLLVGHHPAEHQHALGHGQGLRFAVVGGDGQLAEQLLAGGAERTVAQRLVAERRQFFVDEGDAALEVRLLTAEIDHQRTVV